MTALSFKAITTAQVWAVSLRPGDYVQLATGLRPVTLDRVEQIDDSHVLVEARGAITILDNRADVTLIVS
jgi:hypothetical protein